MTSLRERREDLIKDLGNAGYCAYDAVGEMVDKHYGPIHAQLAELVREMKAAVADADWSQTTGDCVYAEKVAKFADRLEALIGAAPKEEEK